MRSAVEPLSAEVERLRETERKSLADREDALAEVVRLREYEKLAREVRDGLHGGISIGPADWAGVHSWLSRFDALSAREPNERNQDEEC